MATCSLLNLNFSTKDEIKLKIQLAPGDWMPCWTNIDSFHQYRKFYQTALAELCYKLEVRYDRKKVVKDDVGLRDLETLNTQMEKQIRKKHQGFSLGDGQFEILMRHQIMSSSLSPA